MVYAFGGGIVVPVVYGLALEDIDENTNGQEKGDPDCHDAAGDLVAAGDEDSVVKDEEGGFDGEVGYEKYNVAALQTLDIIS